MQALAAPTVMIERCHDGDTCRTRSGERIRLACIDAPELTGPPEDRALAKASRDYLQELVVGHEVMIRRIGQEMVASGHARILDRYASQCPWALL